MQEWPGFRNFAEEEKTRMMKLAGGEEKNAC